MTVRPGVTRLGPAEVLTHRVFTHPDHIAADHAVLRVLVADLYRNLAQAIGDEQPVLRYFPDQSNWFRRVAIPCPPDLSSRRQMAAVGFFGRVRDTVEPAIAQRIAALGSELVEAVVKTPGILGYSTQLLADERNYANLVLLEDAGVIESWKTLSAHDIAARVEAPSYYEYVRIYQGSLWTGGANSQPDLSLNQVKYLDYRDRSVWVAVRELA